jgi:maleamate amidohydrolase
MANVGVQASEELGAFYVRTGLAGRVGYGTHPAVLLVDMQVQWNKPERRLGSNMGTLLEAAGTLVDAARERDVPIVYVWSCWEADGSDSGRWIAKIPALGEVEPGSDGAEIHPRVQPQPGDPLVLKKGPSGFFNTPLEGVLHELGVDTLLIVGASTSGCIRATAIDALQYGFRAILPHEAIGDRASGPHAANLLDIDAKYGDVVELEEVLAYVAGLPDDVAARRAAADPPRKTPAGSVEVYGAAVRA